MCELKVDLGFFFWHELSWMCKLLYNKLVLYYHLYYYILYFRIMRTSSLNHHFYYYFCIHVWELTLFGRKELHVKNWFLFHRAVSHRPDLSCLWKMMGDAATLMHSVSGHNFRFDNCVLSTHTCSILCHLHSLRFLWNM